MDERHEQPEGPPPNPTPPDERIDRFTGKRVTREDDEASGLLWLQQMTPNAYVESEHWHAFKRRYYAERGPVVCRACGSEDWVELHHPNYSVKGQESVEGDDVVPLCRTHHQQTEDLVRGGQKRMDAHLVVIAECASKRAADAKLGSYPSHLARRSAERLERSRRERRREDP